MYKVFISYVREDAQLARKIAERLREVGAEGWLDSAGLNFGAQFMENIRDRLSKSDEVLVIASERSVQNASVSGEVGAALALGKKVVPIMDRVESKDLPPVLRSFQSVDVSNLDRYLANLALRIKAQDKKPPAEVLSTG
jgi:TIR domain